MAASRSEYPSPIGPRRKRSPRRGGILALRFRVAPVPAGSVPPKNPISIRPIRRAAGLPGSTTGGEPVDTLITSSAEPLGRSDFGLRGFEWSQRLTPASPRQTCQALSDLTPVRAPVFFPSLRSPFPRRFSPFAHKVTPRRLLALLLPLSPSGRLCGRPCKTRNETMESPSRCHLGIRCPRCCSAQAGIGDIYQGENSSLRRIKLDRPVAARGGATHRLRKNVFIRGPQSEGRVRPGQQEIGSFFIRRRAPRSLFSLALAYEKGGCNPNNAFLPLP